MGELVKKENVDLKSILLKENVQRSFEAATLELLYRNARAQGIPDSHFVRFIHKAQMTGANPTLDQIYLLPYKSQGQVTGQILFHYSFLETVATNSKEYEGFSRKTGIGDYFDPEKMESQKQLFCEATVKRSGHDFSYTAWFPEYAQRKFDGSLTKQWKSSPYMMIEKCALAGALRRAFPEALSGVYSEEEKGFLESEQEEKNQREIIEGEKIEKYIEAKEKEKISDEKLENIDEFSETIDKIKDVMGKICDGYTKEQKVEAVKSYLSVNNFAELKNKSFAEVKEILKLVEEILGNKK